MRDSCPLHRNFFIDDHIRTEVGFVQIAVNAAQCITGERFSFCFLFVSDLLKFSEHGLTEEGTFELVHQMV